MFITLSLVRTVVISYLIIYFIVVLLVVVLLVVVLLVVVFLFCYLCLIMFIILRLHFRFLLTYQHPSL